MNRDAIVARVRAMTRDFTASIFLATDIINFINEGIDRCMQVVPEFSTMVYLTSGTSTPILLPTQYHHLLAIYAVSRCFSQDERHYQATVSMNEFESKLEELKGKIESGEVVIYDGDGVAVENTNEMDFVETKSYWGDLKTGSFADSDSDLGVDGVVS